MARWIASPHRKPLLLRGARQVGKSTLVRNFASSQAFMLNEVNLERHRELKEVFATMNPKAICERIGAILGRDVRAPGAILFLDEIQAVPEAIAALRYFYEEMAELPVVAAGSLLEFALADHSFSMPVGRIEYLHLGPMDFIEFAQAVNPYLASLLSIEAICAEDGFAAHQEAMKLLRTFLAVGGMPESVLRYTESGSMAEVSLVHEQILSTYVDDFAKYASGRDLAHMQSIFSRLGVNVARKVKYVNFSREMRSREVKDILDMFLNARLISKVAHTDANGVPLGAEEDANVWKPLFLDVGLMNHANGIGVRELESLDDIALVGEGAIAEQFVGQHLLYREGPSIRPHLNYWLREGASNNAEVDFVLADSFTVLPIEVKAGKAGSLRALRQMLAEKKLKRAIRFDAGKFSRQDVRLTPDTSYELITYPLYAAPLL